MCGERERRRVGMGGSESLQRGKRKFEGKKSDLHEQSFVCSDASIFNPDPQAHIQHSNNTYLKYPLCKCDCMFLSLLKINGNRLEDPLVS